MSATISAPPGEYHRVSGCPGYIDHESFTEADASTKYSPQILLKTDSEYSLGHMPDEVTREFAKRLHYAAYRVSHGPTRERANWKRQFLALRDRIVLGNQKLVYKAVRSRKAWQARAEDLNGEGFLVLIAAVERYNPWLGIRFSTYAYTCLVRALVRQSRKQINFERRCQIQSELPEEARLPNEPKPGKPSPAIDPLERLLHTDHPLLSNREKTILCLRYGLGQSDGRMKLESIGEHLGLSKERIRQLQAGALLKLREAFAGRDAFS